MSTCTNIPSIDEIREQTKTSFGVNPCLWQAEVAQAVLRRDKDIISVSGTGSGKTITFWIPLLFRSRGIQIVVTPLNILGKQQVDQLAKVGIRAVALSGETATHEKYKAIEDGQYRVVVVSPEELLKKKGSFMQLLMNEAWASQIISIIWDEGHCIGPSSWGSFRPAYKDAACLRHILPRNVPYLVTSATLDDHAVDEIVSVLQLQKDRLIQFRNSNDRPNIHITVRKLVYSMSSYLDLNFLIPVDWKEGDNVPKFLVFFDRISESVAAARMLRRRLPPHLRCKIKWFNSEMSSQFRDKTQSSYKSGGVWGLYCTDSFGMVSIHKCCRADSRHLPVGYVTDVEEEYLFFAIFLDFPVKTLSNIRY
ncbi:P-loop containing nucleoside triphosphate hydrolase protein [Dentipellis sp. KUC8613]|nr:P-loop containing nucleoside triphosphate hydrolase protein [Dentipellis sp. KUC8613]